MHRYVTKSVSTSLEFSRKAVDLILNGRTLLGESMTDEVANYLFGTNRSMDYVTQKILIFRTGVDNEATKLVMVVEDDTTLCTIKVTIDMSLDVVTKSCVDVSRKTDHHLYECGILSISDDFQGNPPHGPAEWNRRFGTNVSNAADWLLSSAEKNLTGLIDAGHFAF